MIKVLVGTNMNKKTLIVTPDRTPRSIMEEAGFDYSSGATLLDGVTLQVGQMDKSLAELGIKDECKLISTVKADCAC
ncbi:MAG: hypothetical protein IIW69_08080 [Bacteroidaceae bacterium]|nr:hypothetical protein [Bacteroidaceae bacterium]